MDLLRITLFSLVGSIAVSAANAQDRPFPGADWTVAQPADVGMNAALLRQAEQYALTGDGAGLILRHGRRVAAWGNQQQLFDLKSTTKSIGVTMLGIALLDGRVRLEDPATKHHPSLGVPPDSNRDHEWIGQITLRHLASQTAGFEKPGGYTSLHFEPGTKWCYSDGGPNWLAECLTLAYQEDLQDVMFRRVFEPLGITRDDLTWRRNSYRDAQIDGHFRREFGSGIKANVEAMSRIGYLYLREGQWKEKQIVSREFVAAATQAQAELQGLPVLNADQFGDAANHYGLLWWNNADATLPNVPRDAYWSWGLYDSLIVVIPSLDVVVARAGKSWKRDWSGHYDVLAPFLDPIVASTRVAAEEKTSLTPYPSSNRIASIQWESADSIVRLAKGSDNWPITWGDDDRLYTAYGDGWGFQPFVEKKLSMGLCVVEGMPTSIRGTNLRSPSAERTGQGAKGPKVSSLLMVDGTLFMWIRNTGNSQLAWSKDRGRTWHWSPWKWEQGFGYPVFLNYSRNYENARDEHVYVYSHDADRAYERSDRMVLARVPKSQIHDQSAYQFLREVVDGEPRWTRNIKDRGTVFEWEGHCYRSSVSYSAPLQRYLWCQTGQGEDTRFKGGFAIFDAPEPWGPWTTAYATRDWDVGPGETCCLPTKWMSDDGSTIHLVFSGDDCFSVRKGELLLRTP